MINSPSPCEPCLLHLTSVAKDVHMLELHSMLSAVLAAVCGDIEHQY